jgi:hypothetical protein
MISWVCPFAQIDEGVGHEREDYILNAWWLIDCSPGKPVATS